MKVVCLISDGYHFLKGANLETAKIFMNGRSEAVRLPKNYQFGVKEVFIKRIGDMVLLVPKKKVWSAFLEGLQGFTDDFPRERLPEAHRLRDEL